jgi:geranylgeranyl diphosphate synthase, type II
VSDRSPPVEIGPNVTAKHKGVQRLNDNLHLIDKGCTAGQAPLGMQTAERIEAALKRAMRHCDTPSTPPTLRAAMRHAVFPGGARLRPNLCLSVAAACGATTDPEAQADVAAAIELLHCASLVHDDLPCFDDASVRRGRPTVHAAYGEELAVLAGDGLIVLAFEVVAGARVAPAVVARLIRCVARGVGPGGGLVAGQAWESESSVGLHTYHQAKTGALFEAGARAGALLADADPSRVEAWATFGTRIGEAYQVADDLRDTLDDEASLGKPVGQDMVHNRPNACMTLGIDGALERLRKLLGQALETMPACSYPEHVSNWVEDLGARLYPCARLHPVSASVGANNAIAADLRA